MQADQAKFLLDFLLPRLKTEQATTKKILSAVPPDKGDYKPHPKSMSSLKLSWHLAATEMWFLDAVIDHVFKEDDLPMPKELKPGAEIARWYDEGSPSACRVSRGCPACTLLPQLTTSAS